MKLLLTLSLTLFTTLCFAKEAKLNSSDGIFLDGYDPVAYIQANKAVKGDKSISFEYKGSEILFSSEENKKTFITSPEKMLPAYNGWCAYAMSENGDLVKVDPKTFKVINGKVYLFYNSFFANTLKKWNKGSDNKHIAKANKNWLKYK